MASCTYTLASNYSERDLLASSRVAALLKAYFSRFTAAVATGRMSTDLALARRSWVSRFPDVVVFLCDVRPVPRGGGTGAKRTCPTSGKKNVTAAKTDAVRFFPGLVLISEV